MPVVLYEVADRVATVTLNRPEARNALSAEVRRELPSAMRRADDDPAVDVVILTGTDPAFCAGLDLKELGSGEHDLAAPTTSGEPTAGVRGPIPEMAKPVIGAINGVAVTGGFELALHCSFLVASERARFADTHGRVGIQPGWGLTVLLAEAVGVRRARELSATGNFLDAATARDWGLVNHVVPHDELMPSCRQLAADVVSNDQAGVRRILRTYAEQQLVDGGRAWDIEAAAGRDWLRGGAGSADAIEARRHSIMERGRAQTGD
jgi:enoyl-CoA hydratase/carnithine racemase